ncbi:MAG TPA: hypothetical protein VKB34_05090 [Povalibacter sp.]|nr:hypothetical protein [Povalibacter sp.]
MIDDDCSIEVAQLRAAAQRIRYLLRDIPAAQRDYIANALLSGAMISLLAEATDRKVPAGMQANRAD